jgi:general stress protein 26
LGTRLAFASTMKPAVPESSEDARHHFFELLEKFDTTMLVTHSGDGSLHGRPLSIASKEKDGTLWFLTSHQSGKVDEIAADARALVAMQSSNRFVVAHGIAEVLQDRAKVDELWTEAQRVWFRGKDDPDIALVRFSPVEAEFWDNAGAQGVKFVLAAAKAVLEGEPLADRADAKAHGKVSL